MKNRPNRILGVVVGAVITLAAVVVWLSLTRSTTTLAAGSPERTVQAYLQALTRNDLVQAARLLDPSSGCGVTDLEEIGLPDGLRVTLVSSGVKSDLNGTGATGGSGVPTAHVTVLIRNDDAPLGGVGTSETHLYQLARPGQEWLISGIPWPLYACEGVQK